METVNNLMALTLDPAALFDGDLRLMLIVCYVALLFLLVLLAGEFLEARRLRKELQRVKSVSELKWDAYLGAADEVDYLKQKVLRQQAVIDSCELQERTMTFSPDAGFVDEIPFD